VDGHVENITVDENTDDKAVVQLIIKQNNIPQDLAAIMLKQIESED
jgi:hypothetical protein